MRTVVAGVVVSGALGVGLLMGVAPAQAGDVGTGLPTPPAFGVSGSYRSVTPGHLNWLPAQCRGLRMQYGKAITKCVENAFLVTGRVDVSTVAFKTKNAASARKIARDTVGSPYFDADPVPVHGVPGKVWKSANGGQYGGSSCTVKPGLSTGLALNGNRIVWSTITSCNRKLDWKKTATRAAQVAASYAQPSRFPR